MTTLDPTEQVYSSAQALLVTGLSYRQFDYLVAVLQGHQTGSGRSRRISWNELLNMGKYAALLEFGMAPRRAWELVENEPDDTEQVVRLCMDWELLAQQIEVKLGLRDSVG